MNRQLARAALYAVTLWLVGFAWGSIVFMTPALKVTPGVPFVSTNLAISIPILLAWIPLAWWLAQRWLATEADRKAAGRALGLWFSLTNIALDVIVLVLLLGAGWRFFAAASVWVGYALLLIVPMHAGRAKAT